LRWVTTQTQPVPDAPPPNDDTQKRKSATRARFAAAATTSDPYVDWERRVDEKSGRDYYFHTDTKQAVWEHPSFGLQAAKASRRVAAGCIDLAVSVTFASTLGAFVAYELDGVFYGQMGLMVGFLASVTFKDSVFEGGARSLGKRLMSLEIVRRKDGCIPSRLRNLGRNSYFGIFEANQLAFPFVQLFFVSDILTMIFDRHRRRYGDFIAGTCVVPEMPLMAQRVQEYEEQMRIAQLREEMGNEFFWKAGKLRMAGDDDNDSNPLTEEAPTRYQPGFFYSRPTWRKRAKK